MRADMSVGGWGASVGGPIFHDWWEGTGGEEPGSRGFYAGRDIIPRAGIIAGGSPGRLEEAERGTAWAG